MNKKKEFISVIITNFNKERYLSKSLNSVFNQNYKNFEIILFDDCSTDSSIDIIKKFKKIRLIKNNKKRFTSGPLNQIYGILRAFSISKGKLICLLDSDDKFEKKKLNEINNFFKKNLSIDFITNLPKGNSNFSLKRREANNSNWPSIFPTSCISFRRSFFLKFKEKITSKRFPNLEIDARLIIYAHHYSLKKKITIINKKLTEYVKSYNSISSYYPKFSINWWLKRKEAFDYLKFILKGKKEIFIISLDYFVTNIIYFLLTLFKKK